MSVSTSWIHGNALTIESPVDYAPDGHERARLILTPTGPGAWVDCEGAGMVSWIHLPIPTVTVNVSISQLELVRVFLLFRTWASSIQNVHVYDGYQKLEEFNGVGGQGLRREGNFLVKGPGSTFSLQKPLPVKRGIGLSFLFSAPTYFGGPYGSESTDRSLFVAAAGAEFRIRNSFMSTIGDLISRLGP